MTDIALTQPAGGAPWTCPFCSLLCDRFDVVPAADGAGLALHGGDCARANAALAHFDTSAHSASARVNGQACGLNTAIEAAARLLAASRQPLFGGLGTDVAGARALYALASATGAISDPAAGEALVQGLRVLQDRGGFSTTLAEVRTRADLIVWVTPAPWAHYPQLQQRLGVGEREGVAVEALEVQGDIFGTLNLLAACVAERVPTDDARVPAGLRALAQRLLAARYAVLVYEPAQLPAQGALAIEMIQRVIATLNQRTRAGALALGGGDGAATVNQVFTWLSGLPLRSRAGPQGLEHEPLCYDAQRLLQEEAVDLLLWVASYGPEPAPPVTALPRIVLAHPAMVLPPHGGDDVFIPVSTPGIGSAGHLFRTDGSVLLPLRPVLQDGLPTVADVLNRLRSAVQALKQERLQ